MSQSTQAPNRYIVLDTCIIQHFAEVDLYKQMLNSLRKFEKLGFGFAVSEYVFFESLDGASIEREGQRIKALSGFKIFDTGKNMFIVAARLGSLYSDEKIPPQQISTGDKILAATAFMTNSIIYTTNGRDFPMPFFKCLEMNTLTFKKKNGHTSCIMEYYLEPQIDYIVSRDNDRLKNVSEK